MSTNCGHCVNEVSDLKRVQDQLSSSIFVVAVATSWGGDTARDLESYQSRLNAKWTHAMDYSGLTDTFGVDATPTIVILDQQGRVIWAPVGETTSVDLILTLSSLLGIPPMLK